MQDRYDELENIIDTLDSLIDDITDRYYIDVLNDIKYEAQKELEEVEEQLYKEEQEEQRELEREYYRGRL